MCDFGLAAAGIAIAGSVVSYNAQQEQTDAAKDSARGQAAYGAKRYLNTAEAAMESYRFQTGQIIQRTGQEDIQTDDLLQQNADQGASARSSVTAGAAAAGVSGNTVQALLRQFGALEAENAYKLNTNRMWSHTQAQDQMKGLQAQASARINDAMPNSINTFGGPSLAALGLDIAGSALKGFDRWAQNHPGGGSSGGLTHDEQDFFR